MNLVIDIGNTHVKMAIFKDQELAYQLSEAPESDNILSSVKPFLKSIQHCIISAVKDKRDVPGWSHVEVFYAPDGMY